MIGAAIGGAMKIGGAIIGGIAQKKAAKKQAAILQQQKAENETWYNRRYNEDSTQRADAQRALELTRQAMDTRYNRAAASAAVTGATDESVAAQKEAANNVLADTTANIVAQGDARKDNIEQQYMNTKQDIAYNQMNMEAQKGRNIAAAAQGVANAGAGIAGISGMFDKK